MPAPKFEIGHNVHNTRSDSQYFGQIGTVVNITLVGDAKRYEIRWPDGSVLLYRAESIIPACLPEASFKQSDTGLRAVPGVGRRRRSVHKIPPSTRTPITEILAVA